MKPGDKVRVRYHDAIGKTLLWDGVLKAELDILSPGVALSTRMWRVDVGGVALVFNPADIEVIDEKGTEGPVAGQE